MESVNHTSLNSLNCVKLRCATRHETLKRVYFPSHFDCMKQRALVRRGVMLHKRRRNVLPFAPKPAYRNTFVIFPIFVSKSALVMSRNWSPTHTTVERRIHARNGTRVRKLAGHRPIKVLTMVANLRL